MGNLYNETVERKRLHVVLLLVVMLLAAIVLSDLSSQLKIYGFYLGVYFKLFFFVALVLFSFIEIRKCSIRYRYCVIADELVIRKAKGESEFLLETIKIKDIEYIGKPKDIKTKYDVVKSRKYGCAMLSNNLYCCVYRDGIDLKKLYFQASNKLAKNIVALKERLNTKRVC